ARMARISSRPFMLGMFQSTRATSGCTSVAPSAAIASTPSPASSTSSKPAPFSILRSISRTARESSTTIAFMSFPRCLRSASAIGRSLVGGGELGDQSRRVDLEEQLLIELVGPDQEAGDLRIEGGGARLDAVDIHVDDRSDAVD